MLKLIGVQKLYAVESLTYNNDTGSKQAADSCIPLVLMALLFAISALREVGSKAI